jgi:hypothetical protein
MNQINPLYLLITMLLAFIIAQASISSQKDELNELSLQGASIEKNIKEILALKSDFKNSKDKRKKVKKMLSNSTIKMYIESKKSLKKSLKLKLRSVPNRSAKWLLNKLLNEHIPIKTLKFKRLENKLLDIDMEVTY